MPVDVIGLGLSQRPGVPQTLELGHPPSVHEALVVGDVRHSRRRAAHRARPAHVLLGRALILGEGHLRAVLVEYQAHYNSARPHQGIAQRVPDVGRDAPRAAMTDLDIERIRRKPILNGLINEYTHAA